MIEPLRISKKLADTFPERRRDYERQFEDIMIGLTQEATAHGIRIAVTGINELVAQFIGILDDVEKTHELSDKGEAELIIIPGNPLNES